MKLKEAVKAALDYPAEQAKDAEKSLLYLSDCSGEVGYHARRLKELFCVPHDAKEEEPL